MLFVAPLLSLLTLYLSFAGAVPFKQAPRNAATISSNLLNTLALYEQYAAAAYCTNNVDSSVAGLITCPVGNCPDVEKAGAFAVSEFYNIGISYATGFIAVDHANSLIVLAFRGSRGVESWAADLDFPLVPAPYCSGCFVFAGFYEAWDSVKDGVTSVLNATIHTWPTYSILATGHSLGGAMSTVAVADLIGQGFKINLSTYGSPMAGNDALTTFISTDTFTNYRTTHSNDLIPKLPGYSLGYAHVSPEYWITSSNGETVTVNDVQVFQGTEETMGNEGTGFFPFVVETHDFYFNNISACQ